MIVMLQETTKKGAGVTKYLPSSLEEMMEKLELLMGELSAGSTAVLPHIVGLLTRLYLNATFRIRIASLLRATRYF